MIFSKLANGELNLLTNPTKVIVKVIGEAEEVLN